MEESEKKGHEMSGLRQSFEKMKQSEKYKALPAGAKEELEKAITEFEFTIQTEYEECKNFIVEAFKEGGVDDIEALMQDEEVAEVVKPVAKGLMTIQRAMISHLMMALVMYGEHQERKHDVDVTGLLETLTMFSKANMVADYVLGEILNAPLDAGQFRFGIAERDNMGTMFTKDDLLGGYDEDEEDEA